MASTAARNPRKRDARGPQLGMFALAARSLRAGSGGNAGDGSGPWADIATVERREAASRLRGTAHASQAWRRALAARHVKASTPPGAPLPLFGVGRDEGAKKQRTRTQECVAGRKKLRCLKL